MNPKARVGHEMTESLDRLKRLIDECSNEERAAVLEYVKSRLPQHPLEQEWGVGADIILSAISRSSDLTKRGVRGIIAEAIFERHVLAGLRDWEAEAFIGNPAYDFLIRSKAQKNRQVRIQVKLQRMERQQPMLAPKRRFPGEDMYVVEVQKTRGGIDLQTNEQTRPYRFGDFDILAVNMHPSTRDWNRFLFTPANWLLPRVGNVALINIFQPVPLVGNDRWADRLEQCLEWLASGDQKRIFEIAEDPSPEGGKGVKNGRTKRR